MYNNKLHSAGHHSSAAHACNRRSFLLGSLALGLGPFNLTGCEALKAPQSNKHSDTPDALASPGQALITVTTTFLADMVYNISGDKTRTEIIIPAGADPHQYTMKPQDSDKFQSADMVLYHGLHFEGKLVDILEEIGYDVTSHFDEKQVGFMTKEGERVLDPHFWFDIDLYSRATEEAERLLCDLMPNEAKLFQANARNYREKLKNLKSYVLSQIARIPKEHRYLITPHDAFNYFSRAYDIEVRSPQGVSTDSEVSIDDMTTTVDFIVKHQVKAIFAESTTDPARMERLREACAAQNWSVEVVSGEGNELFSDSLAEKGQPGDNYIDMIKHNVDLIVEHLV